MHNLPQTRADRSIGKGDILVELPVVDERPGGWYRLADRTEEGYILLLFGCDGVPLGADFCNIERWFSLGPNGVWVSSE